MTKSTLNSTGNIDNVAIPSALTNCSRQSTEAGESNWALLAFLRFALALDVLFGHMSLLFYGHHSWLYLGRGMNQESAVFGFLVVSGYSIAASIENRPAGYLRRRFLRIYPLYLISIVIAVAATFWVHGSYHFPTGPMLPPTSVGEVLGSLVMVQLFLTVVIPLDAPTWSLAIEWWLYIAALRFVKIQPIWLILISIFSFAAFLRYQWVYDMGFERGSYGRAFISLAWLWISGYVYYGLRGTSKGFAVLIIPTALATGMGYFTGLPLIASLLLVLFNDKVQTPSIPSQIMLWLGDVSYPMYLCHLAIITIVYSMKERNPVIIVFIVVAVSSLLLVLVDYPIRKRRPPRLAA